MKTHVERVRWAFEQVKEKAFECIEPGLLDKPIKFPPSKMKPELEGSLTKEQAIAAMKEGKKVRHRFFENNEWLSMQDNKFVFEDGFSTSQQAYWELRIDQGWNTDWSIVEGSEEAPKKEVKQKEDMKTEPIAIFNPKQLSQDDYASGIAAATQEIIDEVLRAKQLFPSMFINQYEAIAVIREEYLELEQECFKNQKRYDLEAQRKEAKQLAAMAIRLMVELT